MYIVREASLADVEGISGVYRESFSEHTRSVLGLKTCNAYFKSIHQHDSYYLAVSIKEKRTIAGFAVLHINRLESLGRGWLFADPLSVIRFTTQNPVQLVNRSFSKIKGVVRKTKVSFNKGTATRKTPVFPIAITGYIDAIAVAKFTRKQGIGKLLIDHCINIARKNGLAFINLTVDDCNQSAIEFYNKLNFKIILHNSSAKSYILSLSLNADCQVHPSSGKSPPNQPFVK